MSIFVWPFQIPLYCFKFGSVGGVALPKFSEYLTSSKADHSTKIEWAGGKRYAVMSQVDKRLSGKVENFKLNIHVHLGCIKKGDLQKQFLLLEFEWLSMHPGKNLGQEPGNILSGFCQDLYRILIRSWFKLFGFYNFLGSCLEFEEFIYTRLPIQASSICKVHSHK